MAAPSSIPAPLYFALEPLRHRLTDLNMQTCILALIYTARQKSCPNARREHKTGNKYRKET